MGRVSLVASPSSDTRMRPHARAPFGFCPPAAQDLGNLVFLPFYLPWEKRQKRLERGQCRRCLCLVNCIIDALRAQVG